MTTAARLQLTLDTKGAIKTALQSKGLTPNDVFSTYPAEIDQLFGEGIVTPALIEPVDGATGIVPGSVVLRSTVFASLPQGSLSQLWAQWQIASDSDFNTVVFDSGSDFTNLSSINVPGDILNPGTTYYARVRHEAA